MIKMLSLYCYQFCIETSYSSLSGVKGGKGRGFVNCNMLCLCVFVVKELKCLKKKKKKATNCLIYNGHLMKPSIHILCALSVYAMCLPYV